MQLDPENVEALVALAITDLHTNEGKLYQSLLLSLLDIRSGYCLPVHVKFLDLS